MKDRFPKTSRALTGVLLIGFRSRAICFFPSCDHPLVHFIQACGAKTLAGLNMLDDEDASLFARRFANQPAADQK